MTSYLIAAAAVLFVGLTYAGRGYWGWVTGLAVLFLAWWLEGVEAWVTFSVLAVIAVALAVAFGVRSIRLRLLGAPIMAAAGRALPPMGATERTALEAGTVWWDGELFSGSPDWKKLLDFQPKALTQKEQEFLDGPTEEVCAMIDDWKIAQTRDLPADVMDCLKRHGFFGMIIPEEHGGLGFSAIAHSQVIAKLSSRSASAAVVVMVPNSLGPAELILHYGTDAQKAHYLPRLATGDEMPCFALTEPTAGSDAASTRATGIICRGEFEGAEVIGIRLNWAKRYITLAPIATVVGLAFRLFDPDGLLGGEEDRGITCALIPTGLEGMEIGDRHDPMGVPFPNGPVFGHDVFVPLDYVIGGETGVGKGWEMLMQSLAAGRSVSLPSLSVGAAQLAARVAGAYGTVREQFNLPIGRFEGVEEPLARIGGYAYLMDAARRLTCGAVDAGEKPAVLSAIAKAYLTEGMRRVISDALDIRAGAGVCRGPKNILGSIYAAVPIAITVEGANILTRSMIVYGQGAIRSHAYVRTEMAAIEAGDVAAFDRAFFRHIAFVTRNLVRAFLLGVTAGFLAPTPAVGPTERYFRRLSRFSAAFALISDAALATLGGTLKRREKISGRLADALAWMYLGSAVLKRFRDEGEPERDLCVMRWAGDLALSEIESALRGVLDNLPSRPVAWALRGVVFALAPRACPPSDVLGGEVASGLLEDGALRRHLSRDIYIPVAQEEGLGALEDALAKVMAARPVATRLKELERDGALADVEGGAPADKALAKGLLEDAEYRLWAQAEAARDAVIQVDVFDAEDYAGLK